MARKEKYVDIMTEGRDKGKRYVIKEMPAMRVEKWAARAFLCLSNAKYQIPDEIAAGGLMGLAMVGFQSLANASFTDIEPLLDEMLECVSIGATRGQVARPLMAEDDIEEVSTLTQLRMEVFELHTGFSVADALSRSTLALAKKSQESETTPTSLGSSEQ